MAAGIAPGGQLTTTSFVENFPGFVEPIMGYELTDKFRWGRVCPCVVRYCQEAGGDVWRTAKAPTRRQVYSTQEFVLGVASASGCGQPGRTGTMTGCIM